MGAMKPEIVGPTDWWEVETNQGTYWVQCEFVGYKDDVNAMKLLDYLPDTQLTSDILHWEFKSGYGARLSMPGYLDCTEWAVFDSEQEAREYLAESFDLCSICLSDEFVGEACQKCVSEASHEAFNAAMDRFIEDMTKAQIVSLPGVMEIIKEEFNNDILDLLYEDLLQEHDGA